MNTYFKYDLKQPNRLKLFESTNRLKKSLKSTDDSDILKMNSFQCSLPSPLNVRDHASYPYSTTSNIIVLIVLTPNIDNWKGVLCKLGGSPTNANVWNVWGPARGTFPHD